MNILIINCGSSSIKFQFFEMGTSSSKQLAKGLVDRIGSNSPANYSFTAVGLSPLCETTPVKNHEEAVEKILSWLKSQKDPKFSKIDAVGHRVVHGGDLFKHSVLIDDNVCAEIENLNQLAPLHNPACLSGIRAAKKWLHPDTPMVASFDTAFHHTLPNYAASYAIPYDLQQRHKIRRYGFHGIAHQYLVSRYAEMTKTSIDQVNVITFQLGNGCSATAVKNGVSVDTSMGFTPLEGLVMGTRSGDLDPALINYLADKEGISTIDVEKILNNQSGLLGISKRSNDMRELIEYADKDEYSKLAIEIFCYRARKYLGAYLASMGGAKAVIFSGGIGENAPLIREKICQNMEWCGLFIDSKKNEGSIGSEAKISSDDSSILVYVIPNDEESMIAQETVNVIADNALTTELHRE